MQIIVSPKGTPFSNLLVGPLWEALVELYRSLFSQPGSQKWLEPGSTVSSFFAPAFLMDRAADQGRRVLFVTDVDWRRDTMTQVLRDIYRRPAVGFGEARERGSVTVVTLPQLYLMLQEDPHGMHGMDAILVEHPNDATELGWLMRYLTDRAAGQANVVGISTSYQQERPDFYSDTVGLPQWSMKENPGLTPLGDCAAAAKVLMKDRYQANPAYSLARNSYEFAKEGSLVERYQTLSELIGFALLNDLGLMWAVERHTDIFGYGVGSFMTLGTWCYASLPTPDLAAVFADEVTAIQQPAVMA